MKRPDWRGSLPVLALAAAKSVRSFPDVNVSPVEPSNTTRTDGSFEAASSASDALAYIAWLSAFFLSGRFQRISRTPLAWVMVTWSVMGRLRILTMRRAGRARGQGRLNGKRRPDRSGSCLWFEFQWIVELADDFRRVAKKKLISRSALASLSDPWTEFSPIDWA